ncbi:MAG TPA: hypothetical protein VNH82_03925 [Candidatus Dormibacteraeota bacterium]|nr:hypothetical protein [Candidatus Dormibacteraeota bacterium]
MSTAVVASGHVTTRYLRAFARQPYYIASTLVQPVIGRLLFGHMFQRVIEIPGFSSSNYIGFLTPGVVMMPRSSPMAGAEWAMSSTSSGG